MALLEAQQPGDIGAALAAGLGHLPAAALFGHPHHQGVPGPHERALGGAGLLIGVAGGVGASGPVGELMGPLEGQVVRLEEASETGGVAGTAEVLQEQGVIEGGFLVGGEADQVGEPHADDAGPDGVSRRLPLGDVQGMGQGGDDLRQPDIGGDGVGPAVQPGQSAGSEAAGRG